MFHEAHVTIVFAGVHNATRKSWLRKLDATLPDATPTIVEIRNVPGDDRSYFARVVGGTAESAKDALVACFLKASRDAGIVATPTVIIMVGTTRARVARPSPRVVIRIPLPRLQGAGKLLSQLRSSLTKSIHGSDRKRGAKQ